MDASLVGGCERVLTVIDRFQAAAAARPLPPEPLLHAWTHDPVAAATVLLVLVTAGLWISTFLLWRATVRLAQDAREGATTQADKMERSAAAMERVATTTEANAQHFARSIGMQQKFGQMQLRPYLSVLIGQGIYQDDHLRFEPQPRVVNTGHTPALDVRWRVGVGIVNLDAIDTFRFPLPSAKGGGSIIGPQQDAYMAATLPQRLDNELAEKVKWGSSMDLLTVWGYVSYRDLFGHRHICTFAQHVWWRPKPDGGLVPFGVYLAKHNRTN